MLDALAQALRLDGTERIHLYDLARSAAPTPETRHRAVRPTVRPSVARLVEGMPGLPASVVNNRLDTLAANPLARGPVLGDVLHQHTTRTSGRTDGRDPPAPRCRGRRAGLSGDRGRANYAAATVCRLSRRAPDPMRRRGPGRGDRRCGVARTPRTRPGEPRRIRATRAEESGGSALPPGIA
ncbi:hypothetical protein AB0H49_05500 [Nocardia sp. NPDC050713]|uniref:MmyB family transcriptional regulator n=1 Tax=Nocardia sp. NPDC050713 TaxID=3154511 RepID=UPI0033D63767